MKPNGNFKFDPASPAKDPHISPSGQEGRLNQFTVTIAGQETQIPRKPEWLVQHKRTLSDWVITRKEQYRLLKPLALLLSHIRKRQIRQTANQLYHATIPGRVKSCLIRLEHQLESLHPDTKIKTRDYETQTLGWLRDEAWWQYACCFLDGHGYQQTGQKELKQIVPVIEALPDNGHGFNDYDEWPLSLDQMKACLFARMAANEAEPSQIEMYVEKALGYFVAETGGINDDDYGHYLNDWCDHILAAGQKLYPYRKEMESGTGSRYETLLRRIHQAVTKWRSSHGTDDWR